MSSHTDDPYITNSLDLMRSFAHKVGVQWSLCGGSHGDHSPTE